MIGVIAEKKPVQKINCIPGSDPVRLVLLLNGKSFKFEVDSGAKDNFYSSNSGLGW